MHNVLSFIDAGGETGARIRAMDWTATPLGAATEWPRSLKTMVRIALDSRYAMWFAWGPELSFFCNDAYWPTLGLKQSWAIGAPASRVWAEIWPDIGPRIESVLQAGKSTWDERLLLFLQRSGVPEETYHTFSYSPLPDDEGHICGMLCVVTEDTERVIGERRTALLGDLAKALTSVRSRAEVFETLSSCLDAAPQDLPFTFSYLMDEQRSVCEVGRSGQGPMATEIHAFDWPLAAVLESGLAGYVEDAQRFAALPHGPWSRPVEQVMLLPIARHGEALPGGVLVAGINPYRPLDAGYRRFLELLAGQLSAALASAQAWEMGRRRAEELAELDRAKTTFFSNVSHELRTPLTLMLGPTEAALAQPGGALAGEELRLVHRNQQRLLRLVNSLLDFARIEAGRMQAVLEPVDLADETIQLASVFRSAVERVGLCYEVDCPALPEPVWIDRDMWEKIVLNLLSNAFKYTFSGTIRVGLRECEGHAVLEVSDTGVGVPAHELPRLFERFHRVEGAVGRTLEGTGIGLALVRELAGFHKGTVQVTSAQGQGTTFTVTLPIAAERPAGQASSPSMPPYRSGANAGTLLDEALRWLPDDAMDDGGQRQMTAVLGAAAASDAASQLPPSLDEIGSAVRVLVVDDNADMRSYLRRLLAPHWQVTTAIDGADALAQALRDCPSMILTDVMMPRLDGVGLVSALRADPRTATVPIVMLSARAGEEARLDGLRVGADDYLSKPFSARELVARIQALLKLAQARSEAMRREDELRAETRSVLETIHEGYILIAPDGRIQQVNAASETVTGIDRSHLINNNLWDIFPTLKGTSFEVELSVWRAQSEPVHVEHHVPGLGHWLEISAYPAPRGYVLYLRDITERKSAMLALQEADRCKDEFLATLAHELRNPLAPIRSAVEVLASPKISEHDLTQVCGMIRRQTRHMSRLLDDLLDVSRISRDRLKLKTELTPIGAIVDTAVEAALALMPGRMDGLRVLIPDRARVVEADPVRLAQILTNLLSNAAKYSDAGGEIVLIVGGDDSELMFTVRDNGIGMTAEQITQAFDLFAQVAHDSLRSDAGLGIGLALVRAIAALHGGSVRAHSEGLGRGSEFVVRLPLAFQTMASFSSLSLAGGASSQPLSRRVLVVDDNVDAAVMLATFLEVSNHSTRVAHTGRDAVVAAKAFNPDVVLLDIGLPDINGYEVAREIRANTQLAHITLVAVSGWGQAEDLRRSYEAGIDLHLVKPADPQAVLQLLAASPQRVGASL